MDKAGPTDRAPALIQFDERLQDHLAYDQNLARDICHAISMGTPLKAIEAAYPDLPLSWMLMHWWQHEPSFKRMWYAAQELLAERMAGEILQIADDENDDWHTWTNKHGELRISPKSGKVSRSEIRIRARQWLMERHSPLRYAQQRAALQQPQDPLGSGNIEIAVRLVRPPPIPEEYRMITSKPNGSNGHADD